MQQHFKLAFNPMNALANTDLVEQAQSLFTALETLDTPARVATINAIRQELHRYSPFINEPVDCILWIEASQVQANDYNPNIVAPPEMKLLQHSIREDGYTQPIVAWLNDTHYEVVDGFHRNKVGTECKDIQARLSGYLPLSVINSDRTDRKDRIAATIRHNRARGKHQITGMSDIVLDLKRRNWSDAKVARELGMDADEVLRLSQISGIAEMFADREFSEAWEANQINEEDTIEINEENISPLP